MAEIESPSRFPGERYILVRILGSDDEGFDVEFEHCGFLNRDVAFDFLKAVVNNSEEV